MLNVPKENSDSLGLNVTLSRRQLYGVLAVTTFTGVAGLVAFTDFSERLERKGLLDRIVSEVGENRRSAVSTLVESIVMWAGNMTICHLMDKKGIMHGTHAVDGEVAEEFAENHPLRDYFHTNITMPILEEVIFRLVPASFFTEEKPEKVQLHWNVGLTANIIFSAIHNFGSPEPGKFRFTLTSLPLEQFILGAYCWYAQRKGGFIHSAGAHILYNNLCAAYEARSNTDEIIKNETKIE